MERLDSYKGEVFHVASDQKSMSYPRNPSEERKDASP